MKALYPFVGGSAASHKFNLKDPRDVDAAFRLTFNGGGTHDSNGYQLNGSNAYANTFFVPNTSFISQNRSSFGVYSRTDSNLSGKIIMGSHGGNGYIYMYLKDGTGQYALNNTNWSSFGGPVSTYVSKKGFFQASRNNSSTTQLWQVDNSNYSSTSNSTGRSTLSITIGDCNGLLGGYAENVQVSFSYIGDDLSSTDLSNYYTAVQKFQTSLGRQVGTPVYNTNGLVLNLDAGNANSYPGTGTTWFDLASGNNGTLVNGPTYDINNGGSILFDGVNDYVDLGSNFRFNDTDITYDFWFKVTDNSDVYHEIITLGSSNQSNSISLWKWRSGSNSGKVFANINIVGFTQTTLNSQLTGADILNTIVNYTAVFKKESGVYKLYLYRNGILDASTTSNVTSYNMNNWSNFEARIGSGSSTFPELWKGNIYSGKVYNRALSSTEVLQNFNNTRGRFGL
jgi:hypothetical protein